MGKEKRNDENLNIYCKICHRYLKHPVFTDNLNV